MRRGRPGAPRDDDDSPQGTTRRFLLAGGLVAAAAVPDVIALFPYVDAQASASMPPTLRGTSPSAGQDVRRFGAKGDGRTDDGPAIRKAIESVAGVHADQGGGGVVYFPAGIYAVGTPLLVPKNVFLTGDGPIASRLVYSGSRTDVFVTFGRSGEISTYSGVQGLWVDSRSNAATGIRLWGPQEGATISETVATGATEVVVDIRSAGIAGGSNKFVLERCWLWTDGDAGFAGVRLGAGSGPLSIRDSTMVGTNRTGDPPARSGGIVASGSTITADNVNVERFESHSYLDRTMADIRDPSGFFNRYGVRTSPASTGTTLLVTNADFDRADQSILDEGSGVTLRFARSYWNEAYAHDRRNFRRNFWEVGSVNVYQSDEQQATIGYEGQGISDTSRFKFTVLQGSDWQEVANISTDGRFGSAESKWDGAHLRLGVFHLWVDTQGRLRMKEGAPQFETDGTVVGS